MKKIFYILAVIFFAISCQNDDYLVTPKLPQTQQVSVPTVTYTSGSADFSNYISMGNSLTAGYSDGALFVEGQEHSYPNILAGQFALAGGGSFTQPLMNDNLGGLLLGGNQIADTRLFLSFTTGSPVPTNIAGMPTTEVSNVLTGPFNNMGVPGAKVYHLLAQGYGNVAGVATGSANPYFARMASSSNASVIGDAVAENPSFFSLWIGANDILGYATSGGVGIDQTGNLNASTYGSNDITDPQVFAGSYNALLQNLTASGAKGIVANLPSITSIPYFTTVPYNAIPLDAATAAMLNQAFAPYNAGIQSLAGTPYLSQAEANSRIISFQEGNNAVLILDKDLTDLTVLNAGLTNMRQATAQDLLVLTSQTVLGTLVNNNPQLINGVSVPLADNWVLTPEEQNKIDTARLAYNQTISGLAQQYNLAFFDADQELLQMLTTGITQNNITTTAVYATGGGFSLDGVHPSPRGYAIIANGMIDAINAKYGSDLPKVNVGNYKGLYIN